jgi:hypothetical protein
MRKPRRTLPVAPVMKPELRDMARQELEGSYAGFVSNMSNEDPKHFIARNAAAREALEHLAQLRDLAGDPAEAEPSEEALLAEARAAIADENKP